MKLKYKLLTALATFAMVASASNAMAQRRGQKQDRMKLGAQGVFAMPLGTWGDGQGVGFGATLNFDMALNAKALDRQGSFALTGRLGYVHMVGKSIDTPVGTMDGPSVGVIPVYVGAKYYFIKGLYAGADLGLSVMIPGDAEMNGQTVKNNAETTYGFGLAVNVGYVFARDFDVRAFFWMPDLASDAKDQKGEDYMPLAIGAAVGYRFMGF